MFLKHTPGHCPVHPTAVVRARLEDGYLLSPLSADEIDWNFPGDDVIEFEIVSSPCEACGTIEGVEPEDSRTMYPTELEPNHAKNPNRDKWLCRTCAIDHHDYWDELWEQAR